MADSKPATSGLQWFVRFALATFIGVAVTVVSIYITWRQSIPPKNMPGNAQPWSGGVLDDVRLALLEYLKEKGHLPDRLGELTERPTSRVEADPHGNVVDGWGHPVVYEHTDRTFVLRSLGRDGKPGGEGLDYDLSVSDTHGRGFFGEAWSGKGRPTLHQFLFEMRTGRLIASCLVSGALAFALTVYLVRPSRVTAKGLARTIVRVILTAFGAVLLAAAMAWHHIDWGH